MQHRTAVEVDLGERGKGWHYATLSRRGGGPIGDCAGHPPHPTESDARVCYRNYERSRIQLGIALGDYTGCRALVNGEACDRPTKRAATSGAYGLAPLCVGEHMTTEFAIPALGLANDEADDSYTSG